MKTRLIAIVVVVTAALLAVGCGGSKKMKTTKGVKIEVPGWYVDPPRDDDRLVGVATATSLVPSAEPASEAPAPKPFQPAPTPPRFR